MVSGDKDDLRAESNWPVTENKRSTGQEVEEIVKKRRASRERVGLGHACGIHGAHASHRGTWIHHFSLFRTSEELPRICWNCWRLSTGCYNCTGGHLLLILHYQLLASVFQDLTHWLFLVLLDMRKLNHTRVKSKSQDLLLCVPTWLPPVCPQATNVLGNVHSWSCSSRISTSPDGVEEMSLPPSPTCCPSSPPSPCILLSHVCKKKIFF